MKNYNASASWSRYRTILDGQFDIQLRHEPVETSRSIRGHAIHVDDWPPNAPQKGTLIMVHGAGGNGRVLAPFCDIAARHGWRALTPDLPGYGLTRPAKEFRWDYDEWPAVIAELADAAEGPVVLMGFSVGGMTAVFAAEASRKARAVIATTLLDMGDPDIFVRAARWRWLGVATLLGFRMTPWIVDRVALPLRLVAPIGKMTADRKMRDYFMTDPLLGRLRAPSRFFRTMHARKFHGGALGCRLVLAHPGADAWTPTALSRAAFDRVRGPKHFRELTNGSHLPLEQPAFRELEEEMTSALAAAKD